MAGFLLVDASDGEEHDCYDFLLPALLDAAIRAIGHPSGEEEWVVMNARVLGAASGFGRSGGRHSFAGVGGVWTVRREEL